MTEPPDRRAEISAKLWEIAEHHIVAEWICCQPIEPTHRPCMQGDVALSMVKVLLVDSPEAWNPAAPLLDAVMGLLPSERRADIYHEVADRLAEDAEKGKKEGLTRIYQRAAAKKVRQWANEERPELDVQPARDDAVATWLRAQRDEWDQSDQEWSVLDNLLDDYRLHADTGTPLNEHACGGPHCECTETGHG